MRDHRKAQAAATILDAVVPVPVENGERQNFQARDLAGVRQPVALLWGTEGAFADVGRTIAAALPQGELHPTNGAGHWPWLEEPGKASAPILEFLDR